MTSRMSFKVPYWKTLAITQFGDSIKAFSISFSLISQNNGRLYFKLVSIFLLNSFSFIQAKTPRRKVFLSGFASLGENIPKQAPPSLSPHTHRSSSRVLLLLPASRCSGYQMKSNDQP